MQSYSIQTFLKQNALMGEISVKIGVKCNLRFTKQLAKATPGLDETVHYYYLICLLLLALSNDNQNYYILQDGVFKGPWGSHKGCCHLREK